jgi:hypothetical protein
MSSLISSHLLYQTMCNVSEKVGLASPISQRANGHKYRFPSFTLLYLVNLRTVNSQYIAFCYPYIVPISIDGEPARKGGVSVPGVTIAIKSGKYTSCPSSSGCVIWKVGGVADVVAAPVNRVMLRGMLF